jgi:hypothetical protein
MAPNMWRSMASSATPCIDPSIGSIEVRDSGEHRAACDPQQRQDGRDGPQYASGIGHAQRTIWSFRSSK